MLVSIIINEEIAKKVIEHIELNKDAYIETSQQIHANPEIGNEEVFASNLHIGKFIEEGFTVEKGVDTHETAFVARKKSEKPVRSVAFLAEYDALPGIGHACIHNIINTPRVPAPIALIKVSDVIAGAVLVI